MTNSILPLRKQYELIDELLEKKLALIPDMMKQFGIDMWIVFAKEYNEDPVLEFITPTSYPTARRLTCLIFSFTKDGGFVRYNAGRPDAGLDLYYKHVFKDIDEKQFECIKGIIEELDPKTIGLNYSTTFAFGDGLTKSLFDQFKETMGEDIVSRVVSADKLCVHYLETRIPEEAKRYEEVAELAMSVVAEGFSTKAITVGKTTNRDLEWWLKEKVNSLGLPFWFPPTISIQRKDSGNMSAEEVIQEGDLLHVDFGLVYYGLCTDHQRLAYVPRKGETEVPAYLMEGLKVGNRFQDIVCENYVTGRTGNDIFFESIKQAKEEGIKAMLYTHPIGHYGHGPGPTIGLANEQNFIKGKGEYPLYPNTCYALELNVVCDVPEFSSKETRFALEETIYFDGEKCHYLAKGREQIYFVK